MARGNGADSREPADAELLALLLRASCNRRGGNGVADQLLARFGSLRQLLDANSAALLAEDGVGPARLAMLRAVPLLARRYFEQSLPAGACIRTPADTEAFLVSKLRHLPHERFCCLYLDNRHRVLRFDELFRGTIDGTSVYPEVVKEALAVNAAAVILAHNHPSGVAEPSQADERITRRLKSALELVDIRLLDHLIIGDAGATSLASRGLL